MLLKPIFMLGFGLLYSAHCLPVFNMCSGSDFTNDGDIVVRDKICITAGEKIGGSGLLQAPEIELTSKRFEYTGTISCEKKCTIRVQEPFNKKMFKRKGKGKFEIIVDPTLVLGQESKQRKPESKAIAPEQSLLPTEGPLTDAPCVPEVVAQQAIKATRAQYKSQRLRHETRRKLDLDGTIIEISGDFQLDMVDAMEKGDLNQVKSLFTVAGEQLKKGQKTIFMMIAGLMKQYEIAQECINQGADVNGADSCSQTHLITAIISDCPEFVQILLSAGANPNLTLCNVRRLTPLMIASNLGSLEIVKALLGAGADPDARDFMGHIAYSYARANGKQEIAELLTEARNAKLKQTITTEENGVGLEKNTVTNKDRAIISVVDNEDKEEDSMDIQMKNFNRLMVCGAAVWCTGIILNIRDGYLKNIIYKRVFGW